MFPQAFKGSLTTFGEISAKDLRDIQLKLRIILQYVDGLRIASNTYKDCLLNTTMIPNHVAERGYKLSLHRAQLCKHEVVYLGLQLQQDARILMADRKQAIATIKIPESWRWLCGFLEIAGGCQNRIPNFGLIARPLYNWLKGLDSEPL